MRVNEQRTDRLLTITLALVGVVAAGAQAAEPKTIRQYQFTQGASGYSLALEEVDTPTAEGGQVLVRIRAASLNRRDLSMLNRQYGPAGAAAAGIPLSDGAGEVIAVGPDVTRFKVGDRVATTFFERWIDGDPTADGLQSARGGNPSGVLAEVIAADERGLVKVPDHLSFAEAATLPCAGVTAWVALFKHGELARDEYVLLEGTGGVSMFGLLFASAAGAKPIITSSSDDKLVRAKELGAVGTVNYRTDPEWQREVRKLTGDTGVDHVLEVGGQDTLPKALEALAYGGHIALIGGLSGFATDVPAGRLMGLGATVTGIYVGSRADFEAMNAFIAEHRLRPLVDRVFSFEQAPAAFEAMADGEFLGKIVIEL
jgi:NADPH:quinone reductase-like Zn-dependent oxidoreductase